MDTHGHKISVMNDNDNDNDIDNKRSHDTTSGEPVDKLEFA